MKKPTGVTGIFISDAGQKVFVLNTAEKLLNTAAPRVHSDTSRCLTAVICTLNNGFTLFNNLATSEVVLFPVFRLFLDAERQKTG
ncbi:MAG: hypothetical protein LBV32_01280 [Tannerellaceae bacterium]|jgi:hypothetical protein|nr:hypothetical protein [Tannerellaceae bacterium]